jgi:hypothetical protein
MQTRYTKFVPLMGVNQNDDQHRAALTLALNETLLFNYSEPPKTMAYAELDIRVAGIVHDVKDEDRDEVFEDDEGLLDHLTKRNWFATGFVCGVIALGVVALIIHKIKGLI